jgi:hypothetical protein
VPDSVFYVAGHADDALFFRGEGYFTDLHTPGTTTITIVPSAGDSGRTDGWWQAREAGCVESIVGALSPETVAYGPITVNGHPIARYSAPGWAAYFLRLPDGNVTGAGFDSTGGRTLGRLQAGTITTLPAVDGSTTYTGWDDVVDTLRAIVTDNRGTSANPWINTSDPDPTLNPGDHPDHYAVASAVRAFAGEEGLNRLWWVSYDVQNRPANLSGYALDIKYFLFRLYGWMVFDATGTPPNDQEWAWWGPRSYGRTEEVEVSEEFQARDVTEDVFRREGSAG